jgi:hypothetical protein
MKSIEKAVEVQPFLPKVPNLSKAACNPPNVKYRNFMIHVCNVTLNFLQILTSRTTCCHLLLLFVATITHPHTLLPTKNYGT